MRKPITYVNVALLILAVWMAFGIRATWRQNHARYRLLAAPSAPPSQGGTSASGAETGAAPFAPVNYSELVTQSLFSPDRNNEQPVTKVEKKPPPPVPYVIGTLNLGGGMVALMADQKQASQGVFRRYKKGDEIGGYRVVDIAEHQVVIEFEGQKTTMDVYESAESARGSAGAAYQAPSTTAAPAAGPQVVNAVPAGGTTASSEAAGTPASGSGPAAAPANVNPLGQATFTVEGNRKKYTRGTPWGVQTWYEELPPAPRPQ